jgi:hypothetical protein
MLEYIQTSTGKLHILRMKPETIFNAVSALWYEAIAVAAIACVGPDRVHPGRVALEIVKDFGYDSVQEFINTHNRIRDDH